MSEADECERSRSKRDRTFRTVTTISRRNEEERSYVRDQQVTGKKGTSLAWCFTIRKEWGIAPQPVEVVTQPNSKSISEVVKNEVFSLCFQEVVREGLITQKRGTWDYSTCLSYLDHL